MSDKKKTEKPDLLDLFTNNANDVRKEAVDFYNAINDLYNWEEEIQKTEEQMKNESNIEPIDIEPIRTSKTLKYQHNQNEQKTTKQKATDMKPTSKSKFAASGTNSFSTIKMKESKKEADKMKDLGNIHVKFGEYDKAIMCYTDAINYFKTNPIYYSNRALCYLKMEKYDECVTDCNSAIELDSKYSKPYYRRMQAYESLGDIEKAFRDCRSVLNIDPKNNEANEYYNRLKNKLGIKEFNESSTLKKTSSEIFKNLPKDVVEIGTVDKPPHLRSKMPLKRIPITQAIDGVQKQDTKKTDKIKNEKNVKLMTSSASVRNNDCNRIPLEEKYQSTTNITSVKTRKDPGTLSSSSVEIIEKEGYKPPKTTAEFHATWKELSHEEKYLYLKTIEPKNLVKILGAGFNSDILSEIISILSDYYVNNYDKVDEILLNLSNHSQLSILSFFLTENDKRGLNKLIEYMKAQNDAYETIQKIKSTFSM